MAEKKKLVSEITSMDVDFAQWYTDIVKKAEMADYSSVKGCIIMRRTHRRCGRTSSTRWTVCSRRPVTRM